MSKPMEPEKPQTNKKISDPVPLIPPGYVRSRRLSAQSIISLTIFCFFIISIFLIRASLMQQRTEIFTLAVFNDLHEVVLRDGIIAFNQHKMELKKVIR